jgi:hypothetical protein
MNMNMIEIKQLLACLNKQAFTRFIYELWKLGNYSSNDGFSKIKTLKNGYYEQHYARRSVSNGLNDFQGYNLIIPFFTPLEILLNKENFCLGEPTLMSNLEHYKLITQDRESRWFFPVDGNYMMPEVSFVTNFTGFDRTFYVDQLIPKFDSLLQTIGLEGEAISGSIDSFVELQPDKTALAFKRFISKYKGEISIVFNEGKASVEPFIPDKYLTKGILSKLSANLPESIYIQPLVSKSEIIKEFEKLLNSKVSENVLESFLVKYYKEIFGQKYDRIENQLWLKFPEIDISGKNRRIDLFLRNAISRDWELFEIKKPQNLTRTYRDIPTFVGNIYQAMQQLKNYEKILLQENVKSQLLKEGIEYFYPELRLVIGNKPDISHEQWRWLKFSNENKLKIFTFEDLIGEMKFRYNIHTQLP